MLKEFRVSSRPDVATIWGNGHTRETDPMLKGWRVVTPYPQRPELLMIGRKGVKGCATILPLPDERLDVAIYYNTPKEVVDKGSMGLDPKFVQINNHFGWGLEVLREIQKDVEILSQYE